MTGSTETREIILPRSGQAPLKFRGELLAENDGQRVAGREQNRWHELRIYRAEDKIVVAIGYRTRWQGECEHDAAEAVDGLGRVAGVLRDYDLESQVGGYPPGPVYAERQQRLLQDLRRRYDQQVSELLSAPEYAEDISAAVYGPDVRARRREMCRRLEIQSLGLSRNEACAVCDAANGLILDESSWQSLWAEVADAIRLDGLDEKWEIDGTGLVARLRAASPARNWRWPRRWRNSGAAIMPSRRTRACGPWGSCPRPRPPRRKDEGGRMKTRRKAEGGGRKARAPKTQDPSPKTSRKHAGGRPPLAAGEKRRTAVALRLTAAEEARLRKNAAAAGKSLAEFLRGRCC